MADGTNREEQAAADFAQRWIAAVQAMGNQILKQQETFQQMMQESMHSYVQLLNTLHLPMAEQPQEGQQAFQQAFQQASEQWMQLAQQ
jgi:hypothetical protein